MQTKVFNGIACVFVAIVVVALGAHAFNSFTGSNRSSATSSALERGAITVQMRGLAYPDDRFGVSRRRVLLPLVVSGLRVMRAGLPPRIGRMGHGTDRNRRRLDRDPA